jgi:hypothetical protein
MGLIGCHKMLVTSSQSVLCNIQEEQRPHVQQVAIIDTLKLIRLFCIFSAGSADTGAVTWRNHADQWECMWNHAELLQDLFWVQTHRYRENRYIFMVINMSLFYCYVPVLYFLLRILSHMHTCIYLNIYTCAHTQCVSFICGLYHEAVRR